MDKKTIQICNKLWEVPCHDKRKSTQSGFLQLWSCYVLLVISMLAIVDCVVEYILIERNQLPFMIHLPALPMNFKAEHIDPAGGKASSTNSCCQSVAEQASGMAFILHCLCKVKLKNSRMPITNEQTHTKRNYTLHIKCKLRIIVITADYVDGKADRCWIGFWKIGSWES